MKRNVAQSGSASALGAEGRRFESYHSDQFASVAKLVYATDLKSVDFGHVGSIPTIRTRICGISLMVKPQPSKLTSRVRFSHPAPFGEQDV